MHGWIGTELFWHSWSDQRNGESKAEEASGQSILSWGHKISFVCQKKVEADIDSHVEFLRRVDLNAVDNLKEDEALAILSAKLTLNGLSVLKLAMNHVPCTYTMHCREFEGFPLRTVLIHNIVTACCSSRSLDSLADVHLYVSFLEKYCTEFLCTPEVLPHDKL